MRKVAIVGIGITKFGELWEMSYKSLIAKAGLEAVEDAGLSGDEIDALYGGTMTPGLFTDGQEHGGPLLADAAGLTGVPATRVEAACASGGVALRQAYISVGSGINDIVVAGGVEKMTDVLTPAATFALMGAGDQKWEGFYGVTFPALYAMMARRHMHEYGTTEEQMALVAVKNHANGSKNPNTQYPFKVTLDQVMNSAPIADPIKLLDCSPITDGAAAVILASEDKAKELTDTPIYIESSGMATDTLALHDRKSLSRTDAAIKAGKDAYRLAGITHKDIDLAEVHDCFTIAEILAIEALGFCNIGEGGKFTEEGETEMGGTIPVNTSGGLKAKGHPVGATGIAQAVEITEQLRGEAKARQVDGAEIALTHNVGGSGATCVVHIFRRRN